MWGILYAQREIFSDLPFISPSSIHEGGSFAELDLNRAKEIRRRDGCVLLRGFVRDVREFEGLTRRFAKRFRVHGNPHRVWASIDGQTQAVDPGQKALPAHSEMSYNPHYPDTLWFYCQTPSLQGGETIVCDGRRVTEAFDREVREFFLARRIEYSHTYEKEAWSRALGTTSVVVARIKLQALVMLFRHRGQVTGVRFDAAGRLHVRYVTSAYTRARTGELAFANSLEISLMPQGGGVALEGGAPIPDDILDAVRVTTSRLSCRVPWQSGDVLMIDNTRMMHGRVAIPPGERKIFLRLGDLR